MPESPPDASPDTGENAAKQTQLWTARVPAPEGHSIHPNQLSMKSMINSLQYIIGRFETVEDELVIEKKQERLETRKQKVAAKRKERGDFAADHLHDKMTEWVNAQPAIGRFMDAMRQCRDFLKILDARAVKEDDIYTDQEIVRPIRFAVAAADIVMNHLAGNKKDFEKMYGCAAEVINSGRNLLNEHGERFADSRDYQKDSLFAGKVDKGSKFKNVQKISKSIEKAIDAIRETQDKEPDVPPIKQGLLEL